MLTLYNKIINIENINLGLIFLFVFLMPFNASLNNYILGFVLLSSFFLIKKGNPYMKMKLPYLTLIVSIVYFLYFGTSLLWSENKIAGQKMIGTMLSFVLIPISLFLSAENIKYRRKEIYSFFIGANLLVTIICIVKAFINSLQLVEGEQIFNHRIYNLPDLSDFEVIISGYSQFSYGYLSAFMHSSYFALYLAFATLAAFYLAIILKGKKIKLALILVIVWFSIFQLFLATRIGYIIQFMVFIYMAYYLLKEKQKQYLSIGLSVLFLTLSIFLSRQSRFRETITQVKFLFSENSSIGANNIDQRILIWNSTKDLIKENPIIGTGIGDFKTELLKVYKYREYSELNHGKYNAHNQYLEAFGSGGIIGLSLMLCFFILPMIYFVKYKKWFAVGLVLIVLTNLLFESMLSRLQGIVFIVFFVFVHLLFQNEPKNLRIKNGDRF